MISGNWLGQSIIAMTCLIPAWLAIVFFDRNYQIRPDVFLIWYMMGIIIATVFFGKSSPNAIIPSVKMVGAMLLIGLTIGAIANISLFRAVASAPNPGVPIAIANVASVGVFLIATLLARWAPTYFSAVKFDIWTLLGVICTILGVSLIAIRR